MATSPHLSGARQSRLHPRSQCTSVTVHISRHICPSAHLSAHRSQCTSVPVHVWFSARLSHRHLSVHIWLVAISLCTSRSSPSLCAHLARRYLSVRICLVAISQCTSSCRHFLVHICLPLSLSPPCLCPGLVFIHASVSASVLTARYLRRSLHRGAARICDTPGASAKRSDHIADVGIAESIFGSSVTSACVSVPASVASIRPEALLPSAFSSSSAVSLRHFASSDNRVRLC